MDLSQFDIETLSASGFDLRLKNSKTGELTDFVFKIRGQYSEGFAEKVKSADTVEKTVKLMAEYTVNWGTATGDKIKWGSITNDKKPLKFSPENAEMVYKKYSLIRNQVMYAMLDIRNFMPD